MAASDVEVCSNALVLIGDDPISSFDPNQGKRASVASNLYANTRDATLRMHPWSRARKRVSLAPTVTAPPYGWSAQFVVPPDCLRIILVGEDPEQNIPYELEVDDDGAPVILMDDTECKLKYIFQNTTVTSWDSLMTQAIIAHLAWAFSYPLSKSQALRDGMEGYLNKILQQARTVNGQERYPEGMGDELLYTSRFGSSGLR